MSKTLYIPPRKYVNRYTRAGSDGKAIKCPECDHVGRVYHFGWSALGCTECKAIVDKERWEVVE